MTSKVKLEVELLDLPSQATTIFRGRLSNLGTEAMLELLGLEGMIDLKGGVDKERGDELMRRLASAD